MNNRGRIVEEFHQLLDGKFEEFADWMTREWTLPEDGSSEADISPEVAKGWNRCISSLKDAVESWLEDPR